MIQDIVIRSDGLMYGYQRITNGNNPANQGPAANTAGRLVQIDSGTGNLTTIGNDSIYGASNGTTAPVMNAPRVFNDLTITDDVDALTYERTGFDTDIEAPVYSLYYVVRETGRDALGNESVNSKLYRARTDNGSALPDDPRNNYGYKGDIQPTGVTFAYFNLVFSDGTGDPAIVRVEAKAPGENGNGIIVNITRADATTQVTGVGTNTINIMLDNNPHASALRTLWMRSTATRPPTAW